MMNSFVCSKYLAQGKSHKAKDIVCQDYCNYYKNDDFAIIVLSDGAGSCKFSHYGSELLVNKTIDFFKNNYLYVLSSPIEETKKKLYTFLLEHFQQRAKQLEVIDKELSATLLFVFCYKDKFLYGHIGDGIIIYEKNNTLHLLSEGLGGEYKNETVFFNRKLKLEQFALKIESLDNVSSFYCSSDGLEDILIDKKDKSIADILKTISNFILKNADDDKIEFVENSIRDNLNSLLEDNPLVHDDVSLIILNIAKDLDNRESKEPHDWEKEYNSLRERLEKYRRDTKEEFSRACKRMEDKTNEILSKKFNMVDDKIKGVDSKLEKCMSEINKIKDNFNDSISKIEKQSLESYKQLSLISQNNENSLTDYSQKSKTSTLLLLLPAYIISIATLVLLLYFNFFE